jgi:hypothetical protein
MATASENRLNILRTTSFAAASDCRTIAISYGRRVGLEYAANYTSGKHIKVVVAPLTGGPAC